MALHDAITLAADPATVMNRVLCEALALIPKADGAAIELCTAQGTLIYAAGAGSLADARGTEIGVACSLSGLAIESGTVQHCTDTASDPRVDRAACRMLRIASMICVPLQRGDSRIGVLKVVSNQVAAFHSTDEIILAGLTAFVSAVIGAAVELASVTTELLNRSYRNGNDFDTDGLLQGDAEMAEARSRFVANVVRPGAAQDAALENRIATVLTGKGLRIVLQPVVSLHNGSIIEVEALSRFSGPPVQSPDRWFTEAAQVGHGKDLELVAISLALETLAHIPYQVGLAVNAGPETFCSPELLKLLDTTSAERVIVELTEHVDIDNYPQLRRACQDLRRRGTRVAIDDTGSGFAGLSLLLEVTPEIIKLDRQLTTEIDFDPVRRALASALVAFAEETGSEVVAEGIETPGEQKTLTDLGIPYGQGFYLARPSSLEELQPLFGDCRLPSLLGNACRDAS
jgi:EAL domain-containing protein (putative c-di-GMP-specific phosphodiesterase class I)/putative methionine-R-sulfoxide reductase with GAF domain